MFCISSPDVLWPFFELCPQSNPNGVNVERHVTQELWIAFDADWRKLSFFDNIKSIFLYLLSAGTTPPRRTLIILYNDCSVKRRI